MKPSKNCGMSAQNGYEWNIPEEQYEELREAAADGLFRGVYADPESALKSEAIRLGIAQDSDFEDGEEDEDEMDDLAMLKDVLAGWHSKSHEIKEILKALIDGEHICRLDSGSSGEDDLLIGTAHEVDVDVCAHFDLEEIPEDWKITDVTDYIKSRMW